MLDILSTAIGQFTHSLQQPDQLLAAVAAVVGGLLVTVSAFVRTMIPLRWLAVGSNIGFIIYGALHPSLIMVVLHSVLLPVNLVRVGQMVSLSRRVFESTSDPQQLEIWLRPYMRSRRRKAGTVLFERGAIADRLHYLAQGRIELPDVGRVLEAGQMFGEIAFFAPDRRRSSSARCLTDCTVLSIDEAMFKQLVYQNPGFGLAVVRLIAGRLTQDIARLQSPQNDPPTRDGPGAKVAPPAVKTDLRADPR